MFSSSYVYSSLHTAHRPFQSGFVDPYGIVITLIGDEEHLALLFFDCNVYVVHPCVFILLNGVIGRLCSLLMALPANLL